MKKAHFLLFIFLLSGIFLIAQNSFIQHYGTPSTYETFDGALVLPDGFLLAGTTGVTNATGNDFWLQKLDASGNTLWEKKIGQEQNETLYSVTSTPDGGFLLGGATEDGNRFQDGWLARTDANGAVIWSHTMEEATNGMVLEAIVTPDSNYLVVHRGYIGNSTNNTLKKINAAGDLIWSVAISPYSSGKILVDAEGNYILLRAYGSALIKLSPDGNVLSETSYPTGDGVGTWLECISSTPLAGGYILAGRRNSNYKSYFIKTNSTGNVTWEKELSHSERYTNVWELPDGKLLAAYGHDQNYHLGYTLLSSDGDQITKYNPPVTGLPEVSASVLSNDGLQIVSLGKIQNEDAGYEGFLSCTWLNDNDFQFQWQKNKGDGRPGDDETGRAIAMSADGQSLVLGGSKYVEGNQTDFCLVKVDNGGQTIWEYTYGIEAAEVVYGITATADGGYVMAGKRTNLADNSLVLIKLDAQGVLLWEKSYPYSGYFFDDIEVLELPDQRFAVAFAVGSPDRLRLMIADANGDNISTTLIASMERPQDMILTSDGHLLITGWGPTNGFLLKTSLSGVVSFNKPTSGQTFGVRELNGNYIVSGFNNSGGGLSNLLEYHKFDENGAILWTKNHNLSPTDYYIHPMILLGADGNLMLASYSVNVSVSIPNKIKFVMSKITPDGDVLADQAIPMKSDLKGLYDAVETGDGGFAIVGTDDALNSDDLILIKTSADGVVKTASIRPLGQLDVWPNPASGPLSLRFESEYTGKIQVEIMDNSGKTRYRSMENKTGAILEKTLECGDFPAGLYFLRLNTENGRSIGRNWVRY